VFQKEPNKNKIKAQNQKAQEQTNKTKLKQPTHSQCFFFPPILWVYLGGSGFSQIWLQVREDRKVEKFSNHAIFWRHAGKARCPNMATIDFVLPFRHENNHWPQTMATTVTTDFAARVNRKNILKIHK
jgi:hypothetical protein